MVAILLTVWYSEVNLREELTMKSDHIVVLAQLFETELVVGSSVHIALYPLFVIVQ